MWFQETHIKKKIGLKNKKMQKKKKKDTGEDEPKSHQNRNLTI